MTIFQIKKSIYLAIFLAVWSVVSVRASEPIVVLEYRQAGGSSDSAGSTHPFRLNPDYSTQHRVRKNETLSHIIANFYGGSGLDKAFVQMAIVRKNKTAFVRGNPNYLYADKVLHLPSLNEIRAMLVKQSTPDTDASGWDDNRQHIFFFGS